MTTRTRRRRAAALLGIALLCGSLAASQAERRARRAEARAGPLVPVLVARRDLPAGTRLGHDTETALVVEEVPERFAPPDALTSAADAAGLELTAGVASGGYLTAGAFDARRNAHERELAPIRGRQRAVEVAVTGGRGLEGAEPGSLVDVVVTEEPRSGAGRSYLALQAVELLGTRPPGDGERGEQSGADTLATLRVTVRQAVFLTAAHSFAREVRLLPRAPGDRAAAGRVEVDAAGL